MQRLRHTCEVCGAEAILTPEAAFEAGWDYPPRMGHFGVISPRICRRCPTDQTVWWALMVDGLTLAMLTEKQRAVVERIMREPESLLVRE